MRGHEAILFPVLKLLGHETTFFVCCSEIFSLVPSDF